MSGSNSRQMLETKDDALAAVKRILDGNESRFKMVPFDEYNRIAKLWSQYYNSYYVICHSITLRWAGWLLCRYAKHGGCPLGKALYFFKTVQGGTSRLERHTSSHKSTARTVRFQRQLPAAARSKVGSAAALAVSLDIRFVSLRWSS